MNKFLMGSLLVFISALAGCTTSTSTTEEAIVWTPNVNTEKFWQQYTDAKGGQTWPSASEYPEYDRVKEGDTFLIQLEQGPCLMEFFHNRWRRANDVRRWNPSVNEYGGCPFVFE